MATLTQTSPEIRTERLSPLAAWHLLSLDAPTVAALWTWFVARAAGVEPGRALPAAMFLAVWLLYAADRLLDAKRGADEELEARHRFHQRHRRAFAPAMLAAGAGLAALVPQLGGTLIRLYLIAGATLAAWFLRLHARGRSASRRLPKEIAVGAYFAVAVFLPALADGRGSCGWLLAAGLLFAGVCTLNCFFIYAWEHEGDASAMGPAHATTRFAVANLTRLALGLLAGAIALAVLGDAAGRPIGLACAGAIALLLMLDGVRHRLARVNLRAAADVALLTPVLVLPFLR